MAVVVGLILHGAMYGPQAAFLSELFGTTVRYSGVSIGYQLASILAGGLAPIIAVALLAAYHSGYAIAVYVAVQRPGDAARRGDLLRDPPPRPRRDHEG